MNVIIGIILALSLIVFFFYTGISVQHAAQFRYLSSRTVYLTVFFIAISSILVLLSMLTYIVMLVN
jgi:hypothetical protein